MRYFSIITSAALTAACLEQQAPSDAVDATGVDQETGSASHPSPDVAPEPDPDEVPDTASPGTLIAREGDRVLAQTVVHLALEGVDPPPCSYAWSVVQPVGSVSVFMPDASAPAPTFELNVVGAYTFEVSASDCDGALVAKRSHTVVAFTGDALHIELLWRTPGDPDETDTGWDGVTAGNVGSDLDLHLVRDGGTYFQPGYDCYWDASVGDWTTVLAHQPRLDRDDTDGGGPENTNLRILSPGDRFTIGVHYWDDWGLGEAFATVRVYIDGALVDQWPDVRMVQDDLWSAYVIEGSGAVTRIGDAPSIVPAYTATHETGFSQPR